MTSAGDLRHRLTFQRRMPRDDGYGNEEAGDWVDEFSCAAQLVASRGGERVEASSLTAVQGWTIKVRDWAKTAGVTGAWRAVNARNTDQVFNIRSNVALVKKPGWREMQADEGAAT